MKKILKILNVHNKTISFTDNEYKAQGGEGSIYVKKGIAYKIYHDAKKAIPEAKIHELNQIDMPNVLGPKEVIYNLKKLPIGFTMEFKDKTEFLKRMFVKTFKDKNGITIQDVHNINIKMQESLIQIHGKNFIVADHNEMNILIGDTYTMPYYIDVDSWQTPNFKATAIMESVRDCTVPFGTFSTLTDWYAWGIITFQLYTGIHPYRDGRHPKYGPKEWLKRAENHISVFNKDVKLPSFANDFSMIPGNLLSWYKYIFEKGKRDLPPVIGILQVGQIQSTIIVSHGDFIIKELHTYDDTIRNVYYYGGKRYVITNKSITCNDNVIIQFQTLIKGHNVEIADCLGDDPIIGYLNKDTVKFMTFNRDEIGTILANELMTYNGAIYTVHNGELYENTFEKFGKIIHRPKALCNIYVYAYKMYNGVVIQDIIGKCWMAVPFEIGSCTNIHIPELDGVKIIDAKHDHGICVVIYAKNKKYYRTIIYFNKAFNGYEIETSETTCSYVNLVRLPNGICALSDDNKMILFKDHRQKKEIGNPPFNYDNMLYNEHMQVQFVNGNKLYSVTMK